MASVQGEFISWTKILSPPLPPQKTPHHFPRHNIVEWLFSFLIYHSIQKRNQQKHTKTYLIPLKLADLKLNLKAGIL
jgi:hypothetical protein